MSDKQREAKITLDEQIDSYISEAASKYELFGARLLREIRIERDRYREALGFYARHEHWMELTSDSDVRRLLVAMQGDGVQNGWLVAEKALSGEK